MTSTERFKLADDAHSGAAAFIAAVERRARRLETPCGKGSLVWRAWGSGRPILLVHGAQGSWLHWIRNIDALAAKYTVWSIDVPGFGESAIPLRQDHRGIADAIAAGLKRVLPGELPLDVVGFSFGGIASAHLAVLYPDRVRRLIVVDAGGLDTPLGEFELQRVGGTAGAERTAALRANLLALMLRDPASIDELALHIQARHAATRVLLDVPSLVLPDKLKTVLPRITVQLDAIWGELDQPHPNPFAQERVLREFHPDMEFRVVPEAGHWVMYERPEQFNRTLLDLLDRPLRSPLSLP